MKKQCEIQRLNDAIEVDKGDGTHVYYHIFPEYEIHLNEIMPHTLQQWHYHSQIEEVILVNEGQLTCYEENQGVKKHILFKGDVICVHQSIHTFANETDQVVQMTVFRCVPQGKDQRQIMKNDKTPVTNNNQDKKGIKE